MSRLPTAAIMDAMTARNYRAAVESARIYLGGRRRHPVGRLRPAAMARSMNASNGITTIGNNSDCAVVRFSTLTIVRPAPRCAMGNLRV